MKNLLLIVFVFSSFSSAFSDQMTCHGDLKLMTRQVNQAKSETVYRPSNSQNIEVTSQNGFSFTVLDSNETEILKIWPWRTIQTKIVLTENVSKERKLSVKNNGVNSVFIQIESRDHKKNEELFCEVEDEL